ncbi:MAG TPA: hypothetical protein VNS63_15010 [Blastocatellia bacterium]|nr:hypothetical protein [Blastocatellia bacterium]
MESLRRFHNAATDDDLLGFIRRGEWRTEVPTFENLRTTIQQALISMHGATPNTVEAIYERLFFDVFGVLSRQ